MNDDPFAVLGLPARIDVTDDDVRAAWRRIAAATHPDREDGGDPARFGAAAAAYATLRTRWGRTEALADLGRADLSRAGSARARRRAAGSGRHARGRPGSRPLPAATLAIRGQVRDAGQALLGLLGTRRATPRPKRRAKRAQAWKLAARAVTAGAIGGGVVLVAGWTPGTIGVLVGALTWLAAPLVKFVLTAAGLPPA